MGTTLLQSQSWIYGSEIWSLSQSLTLFEGEVLRTITASIWDERITNKELLTERFYVKNVHISK